MFKVHDRTPAVKAGGAGSRLDWQTVLDLIETTRSLTRRQIVKTMVASLAVKFTSWRIDGGKAVTR